MSIIRSFIVLANKMIPSIVSAVLILILAFIVASIAKSLVVKGLRKIRADKYTDKLGITDEKTGSSLDFLGKLVFFIVFLLFLPGVMDKLGIENVSVPIASMVSQFLIFIPNIIAAAIILIIGIFVANIIRQLLIPVLKRLNVDKIQEKAGIKADGNSSVSSVISYLVYVLILIPVIIAALQVLNISAISEPAISMLNKIVLFLPNIFVSIAIVVIGLLISRIAGKLLTSILSSIGTDTVVKKVLPDDKSRLQNLSLSKIIGETVKYVIMLLFIVEAINVINLEVLRFVGEAIISYLPMIIGAIIIIIAALLLATWIENLIKRNFPDAKLTALAAKSIIIVLAAFMVFNQLGIASTIVNATFIITLSAVAVAFAIAFGIAGREFASNVLKKVEDRLLEESKEKKEG